jgi:hypothetical protein
VVVAGSGFAGLSAAAEAGANGSDVGILEDMALMKQMFTSVLESDCLAARHFSKGIPCGFLSFYLPGSAGTDFSPA